MKPGTVDTPASAASFFEVILSPIARIAAGRRPDEGDALAAASASAKSARSLRKP